MTSDRTIALIEDIPFEVNREALLRTLHIEGDSPFVDDLADLACQAAEVARPKGVYRLSTVELQDENSVRIDGVAFTSRVLRVNLGSVHRVFPFLATCGAELEAWSRSLVDPMQAFWADAIKEQALRVAVRFLGDHLARAYGVSKRASMNPGSLADWPITQQRPLFSLFEGADRAIGITLTESYLMFPVKSVSGVWFETEDGYVNCQLCPRIDCPGRRAPYDPHLMPERYGD
ncbi:MAG TPA: vitamin B12 dependent-methionine synthase activation domain-containing protein [Candidatus Hydrogenedentes bacterium]|nr:vitamin B12 dependent-methionine synthase activation domain-containing protein [Candidatus Hydrogenedentota bacterium]HPG67012.1 vitamin B12 dependent-methionine synthase activation domain-containing protein [Candidatus Hydrogenedentota bacterium]